MTEQIVYRTDIIRELIKESVTDSKFDELCFDFYREVYNEISAGLTRSQKIQILIDYCDENSSIDELLEKVKAINPSKYSQYEPELMGPASESPNYANAKLIDLEIRLKGVDPKYSKRIIIALITLLAQMLNARRTDIKEKKSKYSAGFLILYLQMPSDIAEKLLSTSNFTLIEELGIEQVSIVSAGIIAQLLNLIKWAKRLLTHSPVATGSVIAATTTIVVIVILLPEPNQIAYVSSVDSYPYIFDVDTNEVQLLTDQVKPSGWLTWSPDGESLTLINRDETPKTSTIYSIDPDGNNLTQLTQPISNTLVWVSWSPDGTDLLLNTTTDNVHGAITVMNVDNNRLLTLTDKLYEEIGHASWSPDGNRISFYLCEIEGSCGVYIMNSDGTEKVQLSSNAEGRDVTPAWSPDGLKIAYASSTNLGMATMRISFVDLQSYEITHLTEFTENLQDSSPQWSPDGEQIIFTRCVLESQSFPCNTFIMNSDGTEQTKLISDSRSATWRPISGRSN